MGPAAAADARGARRAALAGCVLAAALLSAPSEADARSRHHHSDVRSVSKFAEHHAKYRHPLWPLEIPGGQYLPVAWPDVPGWDADDQLAALKTFRVSCRPILAAGRAPSIDKPLGGSLWEPCHAARSAHVTTAAEARAFFEQHFVPLQISRLGEPLGFVTGYYEPVIEGSPVKTDDYTVPVYRRPSNLFVRGYKQDAALPNGGPVFRKIGRRKLVPYYDRGEIEDGAVDGRGLEICWLKSQTDLLFAQIQGSARIKLPDGRVIRINYDAHNGFPYTPVGRILIERGIIPREEMSMHRIRDWMDANPEGAKELRRANRSYVFFRKVELKDDDEAIGAQGVPLTPGRSIAVDKGLHVYGTPFFITGELPIDSPTAKTAFRRLMIGQDTGSAIVGPARADLYFGAGAEAGAVAGRIRHPIAFAMLVPKSLDPVARARSLPVPEPRPPAKANKPAATPPKSGGKDGATTVPTPDSRPATAPSRPPAQRHRSHHSRHHRYLR
ncbi:murein transglycosylase A [Rhodopseudomonas palustris]|uniref:murein transglycosylase A n=1 Tax=Rhodopseudomonas palustris TaxID=1076 RepID=UPI0021F318AC|nr:murein transglycosylase A [Rhodopseudomonas palustris]UYO54136.1 murein transglycosylase A [Rhodopseudomonas palustris]